jgi:2,3-bisphosphoglycerate-dependent phosphoglycerate mutase
MTSRVYLIRHAETARPDVFHGFESDIDLGARGYREAAALGPVVAGLGPDVLVSSNMLRARRTAEAISQAAGLPVRIEPSLHERKVGDMHGTPIQGEFGVWPDTLARWVTGDTGYAPPGMESFDQICDRVLPVWDRITGENAGKTLAVVAHGIVIRVILLSVVEGYNAADWPRLGRIPNASISEVTGSGWAMREMRATRAWRLVRVGQVPDEVRRAYEFAEAGPRPRGGDPAAP